MDTDNKPNLLGTLSLIYILQKYLRDPLNPTKVMGQSLGTGR